MSPPSNSTALAIPTDANSAGVMSVHSRPSAEVHRVVPKAPSKPMAIRPSPPGTIVIVELALRVSGTVASSQATVGGAVGVETGVGSGDAGGVGLGVGVEVG